MVTYKNILYCTDFSENAKAALPFAIDIAKKYGATLHIVHVYQDPSHLAEFEISSNVKMDWIRVAHALGTETEKKLNEELNSHPYCRLILKPFNLDALLQTIQELFALA